MSGGVESKEWGVKNGEDAGRALVVETRCGQLIETSVVHEAGEYVFTTPGTFKNGVHVAGLGRIVYRGSFAARRLYLEGRLGNE